MKTYFTFIIRGQEGTIKIHVRAIYAEKCLTRLFQLLKSGEEEKGRELSTES